jgi:hypothetical protein
VTGAGTFSTGTGAVTLNGDTSTASGVTITAGSGVSTGTAITVGTGTTTGKAVAITTGNGITSGQAATIDTGSSTFTSTAGGALGITSTGNFVNTAVLVGVTANTTTAGTLMNLSATSLSTNGEALNIALGTTGGTEPTTAKAIRVALGNTAAIGLYVNTGATYTGDIVHIEKNGVDLFRVTDTGIEVGSTANSANIKAIEIGTCTNPGGNVTNWTCSSGAGSTTGITWASVTTADAITITGRGVTANVGCFVAQITAGTSFQIRCNANPGNGTVYNVLIVRP